MEEILKVAEQLGAAIGGHARLKALKEAQDAFDKDETARELQLEYDAAVTILQEKAEKGEPLEPDDKRREAELRTQVAKSETIRAVVRAQADFTEVMRAVNEVIERAIGS